MIEYFHTCEYHCEVIILVEVTRTAAGHYIDSSDERLELHVLAGNPYAVSVSVREGL